MPVPLRSRFLDSLLLAGTEKAISADAWVCALCARANTPSVSECTVCGTDQTYDTAALKERITLYEERMTLCEATKEQEEAVREVAEVPDIRNSDI
jgi:hypothetical protein